MSERIESEVLVLASLDANHDRIHRVLTVDDALVPVIGRQARRGAARRGAVRLEPLTRATITWSVRPRDDLARLEATATHELFPVLKGDVVRYALASTMAEVTLHLVPDFAREEGLYELLLRAWRWLDSPQNRPVEEVLLLFELRALALTGTLPPTSELQSLSADARDAVDAWLGGQWRLLEPRDTPRVAATLEALLSDASGRRLKSRGVLDQLLPR